MPAELDLMLALLGVLLVVGKVLLGVVITAAALALIMVALTISHEL